MCDAERLSYAEADRRSAQLARGLIALGAGKGAHVGLLYPNGAAFVVGMLAAARIGAVVVPFSTFATAPELAAQLVDSDTEILLAAASFRSHDYRKRLADIKGTAPLLRHVLIDSEPDDKVDATLLEAEQPTMTNGFVAGITRLARHPSLPGRDLSSMRRGNLYPIMAPDVPEGVRCLTPSTGS